MKDVPVKFRGRFWLKDDYVEVAPKDGEIIYGGYARMNFIVDDGEGDYIINENGLALLVYPDSVVQLCGYDADGNEVYEGDKVRVGDEVVKVEWNYLIDSGRVTFKTSPPNLQFNIEGSDVNKIYALIAELQNKFGNSANLNVTANLKVV